VRAAAVALPVRLSAGGRLRRLRANLGWVGIIAAAVIAAIAAIAVLAPLLAPSDPNATDLSHALVGSSSAHPLGTDASGRDLLSRLIMGSRASLVGPALVVFGSATVGTLVAVACAWLGGWVDGGMTRVIDVLFAFPGLLLAILVAGIFGPGLAVAVIAVAIAQAPYMARLLRGPAMRERAKPYIAALEAQGFGGARICARHLVPNIAPLIVVQATLAFGYAMVELAALSYLGLGVQPPTPDWGSMVAEGQNGIVTGHPQESLYAVACIVVTVTAFGVLGECLNRRIMRQPS
jgi:peptide/nickel transport system permease protein